tara:strand:- start:47 stop:658 length:612 start_codon:yes stop_codon:yes gene_type:complete
MTLKLNGSTSGSSSIDAPASGSDRTITCPDATGTMALTSNILFSSYAIICDRKDSTTDGGTFTTGAWRQRDLNHEIADPDSIVSISSNEFTLQAGTYLIKWTAPGYDCDRHVSRLYDVTNSAHKQYGWTAYAGSASSGENRSNGFCRVTISGATAYRIDHACQTTKATYGLGLASETNASGANDVGTTEGYSIFTVVEIYKET